MSDELNKVSSDSVDITQQNIEKLKELFPEILTEKKIDFEKLRVILGDEVDDSPERYSFTWNGKKQAMKLAQQPTTATLKPNKEKSKNWDETQNLYIEGDNLEVLKLLQKAYSNKVKMIYIDPPYNTGKDFVYKDNFKDSIENYLEQTGQVDSEGNKVSANTESNGRYHTDWLNMMYPRLKLARNLLVSEGVIFVSIGSDEVSNLQKVMDELFGEQNHISTLIWQSGRKNDSKFISDSHEYILLYVKSKKTLTENKVMFRETKDGLLPIYEEADKLYKQYGEVEGSKLLKKWFKELPFDNPSRSHQHYSNVDDNGPYFTSDISWPGGGGPLYDVVHPITGKPVKKPSRGWLFSKERMTKMIKSNRVSFGEDETKVPTYKRYLRETATQVPNSVFYNDNRGAMKRLRNLMNGDFFEFPKDEFVLEKLFSFIPLRSDDIILDCFSGSGSTAHSVFLNNVNRKLENHFILVQLPEKLDKKSSAYKAGYSTIPEIAEERIRRAGKKIIDMDRLH